MNARDYYDDDQDEEFDYEKEAAKQAAREKKRQAKKQQRYREVSMPVVSERAVSMQELSSVTSVAKMHTSASYMHLQNLLAQYYDRQVVSKDIIQNYADCTCCVTVGNVDSGKSTVFGHLFALLYENASKEPDVYAHYLDTSDAERERGVTMSVNSYYLTINERVFLMQDCPGHAEYSDSIFTQVLKPDCGIIVIESFNFERTKEQINQHLMYLMIFAVRQIVVLVNKMDRIGYSKEKFDAICAEVRVMMSHLQLASGISVSFVPCAGTAATASNLIDYCEEMSYAQQTVRQSLYTLKKDKYHVKSRFPSVVVIDVVAESSCVQAHIFVDDGVLCVDDVVFAQPSMILFKIAEIVQPTNRTMLTAGSRALVVMQPYLKPVQNLRVADSPKTAIQAVHRGDAIELAGAMLQGQIQTSVTTKIRVYLLVTEYKGVCIGDEVEVFVGIYHCEARLVAIDAVLQNKEFLTTNQSFLRKGQLALVVLRFNHSIVCRKMEDSKVFGRVVLRIDQKVVGFGFIMGIRKKN